MPQPTPAHTRHPLHPRFAWLEITGFCNLRCRHCYAGSSPQGSHGTMTDADWLRVLGELAGLGVRDVQFIGGEPTLHPGLPGYIDRALEEGMAVEVFSNMTHIRPRLWDALRRDGVRLAFSYYSDDPAAHDAVTGAGGAHARTRANIRRARELGVPLRGNVVELPAPPAHAEGGRRDLLELGIREVGTDRVRPYGRGAAEAGRAGADGAEAGRASGAGDGAGRAARAPECGGLCGRCGHGRLAVLPDGRVTPCVFARWLTLGNVREQGLPEICAGAATRRARDELAAHFPPPADNTTPVCLPDCGPAATVKKDKDKKDPAEQERNREPGRGVPAGHP
ncbi:radical SAM protein [Streptomyces harbinensis]|uniref:radical SAM protein n=1 Tax=Streptomyces harbinensis TaxID=1176198 RepID=UPI0036C6B0A2